MPTALTAPVADGSIEFSDFVLSCAEQDIGRSLPPSGGLFEVQGADDLRADIADAEARLAKLEKLTPEEYTAQYTNHVAMTRAAFEERRRVRDGWRANYTAMLERVLAWQVPNTMLLSLKVLMLRQLKQAIKSDCDDADEFDKRMAVPAVPQDQDRLARNAYRWWDDRITELRQEIEDGKARIESAEKAVAQRNEYLRALRASIGV